MLGNSQQRCCTKVRHVGHTRKQRSRRTAIPMNIAFLQYREKDTQPQHFDKRLSIRGNVRQGRETNNGALEMLNLTAVRPADGDANKTTYVFWQRPRSDNANKQSGVKSLDTPMLLAKKRPKHDSNPKQTPKHNSHGATSCVFVGTQATREPQVLGRAKSTISPERGKTRFGNTAPTTSTSHGWPNNFGRHQPYHQQHHPDKMDLNAQENRAVFGETFTHSHSPSE